MRIYIAAPWTQKAVASQFAAEIEKAGHVITKKWWEHREVPGYLTADIGPAEQKELQDQASEDIQGVLNAEAFVLLNLEKSEGKSVETGIAMLAAILLAHGVLEHAVHSFILVGGKSNLFHYVPVWQDAATAEDVVKLLAPTPPMSRLIQ